MSCVTCYMSPVTCPLLYVAYQLTTTLCIFTRRFGDAHVKGLVIKEIGQKSMFCQPIDFFEKIHKYVICAIHMTKPLCIEKPWAAISTTRPTRSVPVVTLSQPIIHTCQGKACSGAVFPFQTRSRPPVSLSPFGMGPHSWLKKPRSSKTARSSNGRNIGGSSSSVTSSNGSSSIPRNRTDSSSIGSHNTGRMVKLAPIHCLPAGAELLLKLTSQD